MGEQESFPMTGGDGPYSYAKNSNPQKNASDRAKPLLVAAINESLDMVQSSPTSTTFCIADLGCSVGPNTFSAVSNIIEAIEHKYQAHGHTSCPLEFHVFFSDHVQNDFNLLFLNLPPNMPYFAAGVPGSFYGRLFPRASLNFVHCSWALHWLSKVPPEVTDLNSPICNKGRIHYGNAPKAIGEAYSTQYAKDMDSFLGARSQEMVAGGLMALLIPGRPDGTLPAESSLGPYFQPLESSLVDMANEGIISKEKMDSFNLPFYSPSPGEVQELIQRKGCFNIAKMEEMHQESPPFFSVQECRAGFEGMIRTHFGGEILDELFDRYAKKIKGHPHPGADDVIGIGLLVVLKRNAD